MVARPPRQGLTVIWSVPEDTSGFAMAAMTKGTNKPLMRQVWVVLARGIMKAEGTLGRQTRFSRVAKLNGHSLLRVTLEPGHAADVRRLLARAGHPVVGDRRAGHPATNRHFEERYMLDRPFLHCTELAWTAATSMGPPLVDSSASVWESAASPLPGELTTVLARLGYLISKSGND
jgi:hypothetical protein